jgi:hypothetical protein
MRVEALMIIVLFLLLVSGMWKAGSILSHRMLKDEDKRDDL